MNKVDERKRSSNCDKNVHKTSRPKRKRLDGSSIDIFAAKEFKLEKLPSNCLQHILSFVTFKKISQMRRVCKVFNDTCKKLLNKGHEDLERRLKREIERAEKMVYCPINGRSSYDMLHFLSGLREAINNCTVTYSIYTECFVAGKLLDRANCLLRARNSSTVIPYFQEHVCNQKLHPLLGPIIARSKRACRHFRTEIWRQSNYYRYRKKEKTEHWKHIMLEMRLKFDRRSMISRRRILLKKIDRGNQLSAEFLKLVSKLNENALSLIQRANNVGDEMDRMSEDQSNCLLYLSTSSSSHLGETKVVRIPGSKRPNLAALPTSCIQHIVSYLQCDKVAQLRIVCKTFNEVCKKELNEEFETQKQKLQFQIKFNETVFQYDPYPEVELETSIMKDLCSFLQLCKDNCKYYLGTNYCFTAGKVLDETIRICKTLPFLDESPEYRLDYDYKPRPHYSIFSVVDLIYKVITHFKLSIVSKYFPLFQNPIYVQDLIITSNVQDSEKESLLSLEEIRKLLEKEKVKIKEQNDRNRKFIKIISILKKKVFNLNNEISERSVVMKKLK